MDIEEVKGKILNLEHVEDVKHFRFWSIDGEEHAFAAHVVVPDCTEYDPLIGLKWKINEILSNYDVTDMTLQFDFKSEHVQ